MRRPTLILLLATAAITAAVAACSAKSDSAGAKADRTANTTIAPAVHDSVATGMLPENSASAPPTASAVAPSVDQQFLRMMSDHHKGLIALTHATIERKDRLAVKSEAEQLDTKQDAELDQMVTMLEQQYHDAYAPKISPDNQAMFDSLKLMTGEAYDRTFRQDVIKHHQDGIAMIDQYVPRLTDAKLKSMAEKMKANQQRDIAMLQKKLGTRA